MKRLNELGGLRAFRVDTIAFVGPNTTENCKAHILLPENFLPIALTGKIGSLLLPSDEGVNVNATQSIQFDYNIEETVSDNALWTGWDADLGRRSFTTPELRIGTDKSIDLITSEGFEEISKSADSDTGAITIKAKPDRPLYVVGVSSTLNTEY